MVGADLQDANAQKPQFLHQLEEMRCLVGSVLLVPTAKRKVLAQSLWRGGLTQLGMNQRLLIKNRKGTLGRPAVKQVPVHASLVRVKVGIRLARPGHPVESDDGQIWKTHKALADIINTVIRVRPKNRDANVILVVPEDQTEDFQTVQMMIGAELAIVPAAVAQLQSGAIQILKLIRCESEVVICKEATPGCVALECWLASVWGLDI